MHDDRWHGSEDYPGPAPLDGDFDEWGKELGGMWGVTWNGFDTFLRRLLMAGGAAVVWMVVGILLIIAIKGKL